MSEQSLTTATVGSAPVDGQNIPATGGGIPPEAPSSQQGQQDVEAGRKNVYIFGGKEYRLTDAERDALVEAGLYFDERMAKVRHLEKELQEKLASVPTAPNQVSQTSPSSPSTVTQTETGDLAAEEYRQALEELKMISPATAKLLEGLLKSNLTLQQTLSSLQGEIVSAQQAKAIAELQEYRNNTLAKEFPVLQDDFEWENLLARAVIERSRTGKDPDLRALAQEHQARYNAIRSSIIRELASKARQSSADIHSPPANTISVAGSVDVMDTANPVAFARDWLQKMGVGG
jgi:predicted MarR family transcription regulator